MKQKCDKESPVTQMTGFFPSQLPFFDKDIELYMIHGYTFLEYSALIIQFANLEHFAANQTKKVESCNQDEKKAFQK